MATLPTINTADDMQDLSVLNQFVAAANDRNKAAGRTQVAVAATSGSDIQSITWWNLLRQCVVNPNTFTKYVDKTVDRATIGTGVSWGNQEPLFVPAGIDSTGWTRYRPRQISSTGASTDAQGNAAVLGQVAILTTTGGLHEYNGSAWVQQNPATVPDMISVTRSYPSNPLDALSDWGHVQAGDYIGPWLLNELKAVLEQMVWCTDMPATTVTFNGKQNTNPHFYGEDEFTLAAAEAAAQADATSNLAGLSNGNANVIRHQVSASRDDCAPVATQHWVVTGKTGIWTPRVSGFPTTLNCEVEFWAYADVENFVSCDFGAIFDDNGEAVVENEFALIRSGSYTAGESLPMSLGAIGDGTIPTLPTIETNTYECGEAGCKVSGWRLQFPRQIRKYDVAGGFTYY